MLTITQVGLAAITTAENAGFKIKMKSFKLTQHDVSGFSNTDFVNATDLAGQSVVSADISLVEVVGTSTVRLTLVIPKEVPRTGSWFLREIGIYLETGELFATGALNPAYEKNNEYGIKIYVLCTQNRLGNVVSVTVGQSNSLPVISKTSQLPSPLGLEHNVVAVLDQTTSKYADSYSAGLAIRSGPGLLHWAFTGHNRIYHGLADAITTQSQLKVSMANGGFWLNNGEIVIVQCTTGSGAGTTRRMRFNTVGEYFTVVDAEFGDLDSTSMLAIWRDNANQLPERKSSLPDYFVLGHGLNSWTRTDTTPTTFTSFTAQTANGTLNSDSQFGHMALEPAGADKIIMVWCEGHLLPETQYSSSWNVITVYGKPFGTKIDVLILKQVDSPVGGVPNVFESKLYGDGLTTRFYMSIVPESSEWVAVYVDGVFKHRLEYDYYQTHIVLHEAPAEGAEIQIVQIGVCDDTAGSAVTYRTFRQINAGTTDIAYSQPINDKSQVMLFVDGHLYTHADYQLTPAGLQILKVPDFTGGASFVDLFLFVPTTALTNPQQSQQVSGLNTGPRWIDPAGLEGMPNRLIPKVVSFVSDGAQVQIAVPQVINKDYVLVFVDGSFKQAETYTYADGYVILNQPATSGDAIDVIAFTESTIDEGFSVECTSFNFISTTETVYQLASVSNEDYVIVTVDGVYQHRLSYTIDPQSRIFFQAISSGQKVEVWYFNTVVAVGKRTTIRRDKAGGVSSNTYPLSQTVSRKQNVLTFVGNNKYDNAQYELGTASNSVALNPLAPINMSVVNISFVSAAPKTRLLTRAEYNASVVSFNYRTGTVLLTREDVAAVLHREDVLALLTPEERAILQNTGPVVPVVPPHAEPGNTFASSMWTVPVGVYHIRAVIIGGAGGGGGGSNDLSYAGHGGERGKVQIVEMDVTPGDQIEVRLGAGGSPYLYTIDGTVVYPQPGDYGTSDGSRGYPGRNGEATIFGSYVVAGGLGGGSEPAYGPDYVHSDSAGQGQVPVSGTGQLQGGGAPGQTGIMTTGNNTMSYSYPGTNGALGWSTSNSTGGGHNATSPGAGGGGAAADPNGVGAFGGAGANGVVYITWS